MDVIEQVTTDTSAAPVAPPEPPPLSVSDHAKVYGPGADAKPDPDAPDGETKEQKAERLHHSAQQKREKDTGKFAEGKTRHRAESQKATPSDVPRIQQLTAKNSELSGKLAAAERELAELRASGATRTEIKQAEQKVERAEAKIESSGFSETRPKEDDPKFEGRYDLYMEEVAAWAGRKGYHDAQQAERSRQEQARKQQQQHDTVKTWAGRVEAAKGKYADFDAVAFGPTRIPEGSPIDLFVMEDELGPDVLYHLNKHPEEIDSILSVSPLQQVRKLVAIATSLSPNASAAGTTTAAPERKSIEIPPKPPTVVRTEAQRASDGPPKTDGSLSLAEHAKHFGPKARR